MANAEKLICWDSQDIFAIGVCLKTPGGRLQGQTLLIHGVLPQTGAGSPAYEVVPPADETPPTSPRPLQDRLL